MYTKENCASHDIKLIKNMIRDLPLNLLVPMDFVIRVGEAEIDRLAGSLKNHGVLEPLLVRPSSREEGKFEIVCGLRRFKAAMLAGIEMVPCIVMEMDDPAAMEAMLAENLERADLSEYELGRWFKLMIQRFPDVFSSVAALSNRFKLSAGYISRLILHYEFLEEMGGKLPPNIMPHSRKLDESITREIRNAPPERQPEIVEAAVKKLLRGEKFLARDITTLIKVVKPEGVGPILPKPKEKPKEELRAEKHGEEKIVETPKPGEVEEEPAAPQPVKPPEQPEAPKVDVEALLDEIVRLREETKRLKMEREKAQIKAPAPPIGGLYQKLLRYYPDDLLHEFFRRFDEEALGEAKVTEYLCAVVDVLWSRVVPLKGEERLKVIEEIFREAAAWAERF